MDIKVTNKQAEEVREAVRTGYGEIARKEGDTCCAPGCCGSGSAAEVAKSVGYSESDLATLPVGANMGLSCGNPTVIASLREGERVLDLGSGGGFDVFIAGQKVGEQGRAIGVDMTADMLNLARKNTSSYTERTGLDNVEFRLGEIENLPLADNSVDVVISNCVINLSPDKPRVWREIARVLKPGGRVAVSDLALKQPLPAPIVEMVEALIGCVAGAVLIVETERMAIEAGFEQLSMERKDDYIEAMSNFEDPLYKKIVDSLPEGSSPADYVTSLDVSASKPL